MSENNPPSKLFLENEFLIILNLLPSQGDINSSFDVNCSSCK